MTLKDRIAGTAGKLVRRALDSAGYGYLPPGYSFMNVDGEDVLNKRTRDCSAYFSNAWRACALAKARPLAALPVHVYKRENGVRSDASNRVAKDLEKLLRGRWNPFMTGTEGIRWLDMTKDVKGNAYARIEWRGARIAAIWPLAGEPTVQIGSNGYPIFEYEGDKFTPSGTYMAHEVVWVKSPVLDKDCLYGRSLATLAAQELSLSIDLEEFYSNVLNGHGNFPGWLETPTALKPQDLDKIKEQLEDGGGIINAGKIRIFDNGLTYRSTKHSMVDMSLVEQEKWILQQTCRTLSVPPQEVFDLSNATYSNIEQGALNFANKTLVPECVEIERAFSLVLESIGVTDHYVQLDMNGLLRGSYTDRMEGYRVGIYAGFLTRADVRAKEDLPPIPGLDAPLLPTAYNLIDPETGEVMPATEEQATNSTLEPGGSGEGAPPYSGSGDGEAMNAIHADMVERVQARFAESGDTEKNRAFAVKVLAPYARACQIARIPYDMDEEIEELSHAGR